MKKFAEFSTSNFQREIAKGKVVLLFSASWCPDCRFLDMFLSEIVSEFTEYQFCYIDIDGATDLAKKMNILGIPSFVAYQDGQEIGRLVSKDRKTKEEVVSFLKSLG